MTKIQSWLEQIGPGGGHVSILAWYKGIMTLSYYLGSQYFGLFHRENYHRIQCQIALRPDRFGEGLNPKSLSSVSNK
jgi:hypothetical protein